MTPEEKEELKIFLETVYIKEYQEAVLNNSRINDGLAARLLDIEKKLPGSYFEAAITERDELYKKAVQRQKDYVLMRDKSKGERQKEYQNLIDLNATIMAAQIKIDEKFKLIMQQYQQDISS